MILEEIVHKKRERLREAKDKKSLKELRAEAEQLLSCHKGLLQGPPVYGRVLRDFRSAIKRDNGVKLIGEIKVASPSKGILRKDPDLLKIASIYEQKVDAISVITEEDFFLGSLDYLKLIRSAVTRPVLRKDFIIDEYQVFESFLSGADALLLIDSILNRVQAEDLFNLAKTLGMAVLYEIHNEEELERALKIGADIIGINNRDLKTMTIDLNTTIRLRPLIPSDKIVVAESGITERHHVKLLEEAGVDALLVGTVFMEAQDINEKIDELRGYKIKQEVA